MATSIWHVKGWYQTNTEGIPNIYLSIVDEGYVTGQHDTPQFTPFRPRILNPETFSIKRQPMVWPWGDTLRQQGAAIGQLKIDNYDGAFDFLTLADLRDALVVIKLVRAKASGVDMDYTNAPVVVTAILDDVTMDDEDIITVTLKDTIARLDRPLLTRYNPPFVDENAANRMVPLSFGALRNVSGQLIDSPNRLFQLHDQEIQNLTAARDKGALLDVHTDPPQVQLALNNSGIQPEVMPVGKFTVDFSTIGEQATIPGVADVLAGTGTINSTTNTWTAPYALNAPSTWTYDNTAWGTFARLTAANGYPQDWCVSMTTQRAYNPGAGVTGFPMHVTTPFLLPGKTYRIQIVVDRIYVGSGLPDGSSGLMLRTDLTTAPGGNVSGGPYGQYLTAPGFAGQSYTFTYTAPNDGVTRSLYVIAVGRGLSLPATTVVWHGLKVQLLGQFVDLPMEGINLENYFTEILANRAYEDSTVWEATDLQVLDNVTNYDFGVHFTDTPNILFALKKPLDSYCATITTDALGKVRTRRLVDPRLETPIARFSFTNVKRPISVVPDRARYLTTLANARCNQSPYGDADFVTDLVAVPPDMRARFKRSHQFQVYATRSPAGQYANAVNARALDTVFDTEAMAQTEIDRVVGIYSPQVYPDGYVSNGKRRFVTFTAYFDDIQSVDGTSSVPAQDLLFGDTVILNYPDHGFDEQPMMIAGTELFPFAQKIVIRGFV